MGQSNVTNVLKNQLFLLRSAILYSYTVLITFNVVLPVFLTGSCPQPPAHFGISSSKYYHNFVHHIPNFVHPPPFSLYFKFEMEGGG